MLCYECAVLKALLCNRGKGLFQLNSFWGHTCAMKTLCACIELRQKNRRFGHFRVALSNFRPH